MARNHTAVQLALRAKALTLSVVTTGSTSLSATAAGYARAAGSFITDGFEVGMEAAPTGFTETTPGVIDAVAAQLLTIRGGRTAQTAGAGRTLAVGLPTRRRWENERFTVLPDRHYVEEDYVPGPSRLTSMPSAGGTVIDTGEYVLRWYGIANTGLPGLTKCVDALLALFPPGGAIATLSGNGGVLRTRADVGPRRGQLMPEPPGWAVIPVTIPWWLIALNP